MRKVATILYGLFLTVGAGTTSAQDEGIKPSLPAGPLIKKAESYSKWQIRYKYASDNGKKDEELNPVNPPARENDSMSQLPMRRVVITRTGSIAHVEMMDIAGYTVDQWLSEGTAFFIASGFTGPSVIPTPIKRYLGDFSSSDFPDMQVVSSQAFVGIQKLGSISCLVFMQDDTTVWVNLETRYPVAWRRGNETRTFNQLSPPQSMQVLPEQFKKLSDGLKRSEDYLKRPIPRGG